jgi:hypothetical protein
MTTSDFLLMPTDKPDFGGDWENLDRGARLQRLRNSRADLGTRIRNRLVDFELEYMGGVGGWTVRSETPTDRQTLVEKLKGLPVEVAQDETFYAT